jgi:hypothetical protein
VNTEEGGGFFRNELKERGIAARVKMDGKVAVIISWPVYGVDFTETDQIVLNALAYAIGYTGVRGLPPSAQRYGAIYYRP